jgi:hypothetical protein
MRPILALTLTAFALLANGCSRSEKPKEDPPALERAQEKLKKSMDQVETTLAEGKAEARKLLAAARERWDDLRPEAEKAVASAEQRFEKLLEDTEALRRLPPDSVERIRARLKALREKLAEANTANEQGDTELAVEKADDVRQEGQAIEELLVERADPPASNSQ